MMNRYNIKPSNLPSALYLDQIKPCSILQTQSTSDLIFKPEFDTLWDVNSSVAFFSLDFVYRLVFVIFLQINIEYFLLMHSK